MKQARKFAVLLALILIVAVPVAFGQGSTTGGITGSVTADGAPVPGVSVTISSPNLQGTRTGFTDVNGIYNFAGLPPGQYQVVLNLEGFRTVTQTVNVNVAATAHADAVMRLSAVAESITVTASAPAVAETQEIASNYDADLIDNLPIGRTLVATTNLAPGVNNNGVGGNLTISGAQSFDNVFYVDGAVVNEVLRGQPLDLFIEDAIQETTIQTGAVSSEYGRFTGGVVTAITKSGTNEFEGSLRDSFTNPSWTDQTPLNEPKGIDQNNETWEGTFGGRIIRDRLWFFTSGRYFERTGTSFFANLTSDETPIPYNTGRRQSRLEGKLTAQLTPKFSVVGSYLDLKDDQKNNCFGPCIEPSTLDAQRQTPEHKLTANVNGVITNNFLLEASYTESDLQFIDSGGSDPRREFGTPVQDNDVTGGWFGAPVFGSSLGKETRSTEDGILKGTYFLSTAGAGTHNLVAGYDNFKNHIKGNNQQSASDFMIFSFIAPERPPGSASVQPVFEPGAATFIYWPILELSKGNTFETQSLFINDKWDLNNHWSFNVGGRYDKNTGENQAHLKVVDDSKVSPRLGVTYDVTGNGRFRITGSYSQYVSKIANGNVGDASSSAGAPSYLYYIYYGPSISGLNTPDALKIFFDWFDSVGGLKNTDFLLAAGTSGIQTQILNTLKSPSVDEYTLGGSANIGRKGYIRADYQHRTWNNFYSTNLDLNSPVVFDPLAGFDVNVATVENSDTFFRDYDAVILQGGYQIFNRLNLGGNYTWSKLRGNAVGETSGSGPIADTGAEYQPELLDFPRASFNVDGPLPQDQTHKARVWLTYDLPTFLGNFNFSLLERYDSGTPYSITGTVRTIKSASRCPTCRANPGYVFPTTSATYFFSDRGEFRWDDTTATDLGINYSIPISRLGFFFQGEILNVFNEHAQIGGNTTVHTQQDVRSLKGFDPFTETPVLGVNYTLGSSFGKATNVNQYQLARTYQFSLGLRF